MEYKRLSDRLKAFLWIFITPVHPHITNFLLSLRLVKHDKRENYHLGYLIKEKSAEELKRFLIKEKRFEENFAHWVDEGEVVDLRLRQNFDWQYHIRVYTDGEVRAHHEYTPESHPVAHIKNENSSACPKEFMNFLQGWVDLKK